MFDSHFHLTDPRIIGAVGDGVEIGANFEELPAVFEFAARHENIYCTAGVHPLYADDFTENDFVNFVASNIGNKKFVAIGECGLDYHRPELLANKNRQKYVFIRQIEAAHKFEKPLVVHSRDAAADTIEILAENKDKLLAGVLIHCMSYDAAVAEELLLRLGNIPLYFAFGGAITYKQNRDIMAETILTVPRDRILLETDAPYLAPEPKRGQVNRPEYIEYTAKRIAEILNITTKEAADLTTSNAKRFYGIENA
jgi:TatD DNase family protein